MNPKPYQVITDRILGLLAHGTVPWHTPWQVETGQPRNLLSQRPYHGINMWMLGSMAYASPYWATFNQVKAAGGSVMKGEKSCPVVFYKVYEKEATEEKRFALAYYNVFNSAQCTGIAVPALSDAPARAWEPLAQCDALVAGYPDGPACAPGGSQACYSPARDTVYMPDRTTFVEPSQYYSTLFHELGHSTGHPRRLARPTLVELAPFGSQTYSKEELVAEMTAAYLCGVCGIANATVDQSAAYIHSWLRVLRNDPKMLVQAAGQAQKAADWIQGTTGSTPEN